MTPGPTIGLRQFEMLRGQAFDRHVHEVHQLAWASSGVLVADAGGRCWVLPPNLALWIPAGTWHGVAALRETVMQGIYLDPAGCPPAWDGPAVMSVSPLARHLIGYLAGDLASGIASPLIAIGVGAPLYAASISRLAPRQIRLLFGSVRRASAAEA